MGQPTAILVHGTWHGAWCWSAVRDRLDRMGIASIAPTLKGIGERFDEADEAVGVDDHVADVVDAIRGAGTSCVVIGHSYGSIPMWGAAALVPDRLDALIDLDGFLPRADACAFEMLPPLRRIFEPLIIPDRPWLIGPPDAASMGIADPAEAEKVNRLMTPAPLRTHTDVLRLRGQPWSGPRFYVAASGTARLFAKTVQLAEAEGWTVWNLDGGHDLQAVNPDGVTDVIARVIARCT
jgi:pimeloyl-ACP methyl ester carboxylesterase